MSKKIKILLISILLFVLSAGVVNANTLNAELKTNSQNVKPGETFTVTFKAVCQEGINGLESKISYDEEKLEFIKVEVADTQKWTNLGEGLTVQILHTSQATLTEEDIFVATFKVKDGIAEGSKAKVIVEEIVLDSESLTNSRNEIQAKEIELTVVSETTDEPNGDQNEKPEEKPNGDQNSKPDDNSGKEPSKDESNDSNNKQENKPTNNVDGDKTNKPQTNQNNNKTNTGKDSTVANKEYPKTGAEKFIFPIITIVIVLVGSYIGYKKYKAI